MKVDLLAFCRELSRTYHGVGWGGVRLLPMILRHFAMVSCGWKVRTEKALGASLDSRHRSRLLPR